MALFFMFLLQFILLVLVSSLRFRKSSSSSSSKGPKAFPVIGCFISFYKNRHRLLDWYTELLARSPSQTIVVSRFGSRRTIVTANPKNIEHILKTNFCNYPKGKPFTEILGDLLGTGIFNVDGELWYTQRKLVSHEFTAKSLRQLVLKAIEDEVVTRLLPVLEFSSGTCQAIDLQEILRDFAFNIICKVSLGISDPVPGLAKAFDAAAAITARRGTAQLPAVWKTKRVFGIGSERQLKADIELIHDCITKLIHDRRKELMQESKYDFLSRLIACGHSDEMIRDMVISFIMAGRDTTSSALTWFFWLLSSNSDIDQDLVTELTAETSDDHSIFNFEKLKNLKLLKASLCESMRLYPPVAWDSKHAVEADALPDGTEIKKGDRVTYFPYGIGRMSAVWGDDCLEFKPQRWMMGNDQEMTMMSVSPFKFPVFQAGPRVCLGKEMAFLQMKCVAAAVLRRYKVCPVDGGRPVFVPLLTAHMKNGFNVVVKKRNDCEATC